MGNCFSSNNQQQQQQHEPQKQQQSITTSNQNQNRRHPGTVKINNNNNPRQNHNGCGTTIHSPPADESHRREQASTPPTRSVPNSTSSTPTTTTTTNTPLPPKNVTELRQNPAYTNVDIFTYQEMTSATSHFRPDYILGEGGFGIVYKGLLDATVRPAYATTQVAIKELNPDGFQGDREWLAEVNYLGQLRHPNLVKLIGYCCEDEHRLLVYEYMARGSLEKHLFRRAGSNLTWSKRMKIALDAAKGLAFLHGAERSVIYRDFKTSNILLDAKFSAKLSDFGLAKDGPMGDQTHVSTRVMGTYGYAAPEYVMTGHLTARSDVYGFGVVLLEILIGRRAMDKSRPNREHNLVDWARPLLNNNKKILKLLDPKMEGQYSATSAIEVATLTYQCLSQNPKERPLMSEVVELLESIQTTEDAITKRGSPGVAPNEVQSGNQDNPAERRPQSTKSDIASAGESRRAVENGRSKSEPPSELDPSSN